jgi:hypothetical protein
MTTMTLTLLPHSRSHLRRSFPRRIPPSGVGHLEDAEPTEEATNVHVAVFGLVY